MFMVWMYCMFLLNHIDIAPNHTGTLKLRLLLIRWLQLVCVGTLMALLNTVGTVPSFLALIFFGELTEGKCRNTIALIMRFLLMFDSFCEQQSVVGVLPGSCEYCFLDYCCGFPSWVHHFHNLWLRTGANLERHVHHRSQQDGRAAIREAAKEKIKLEEPVCNHAPSTWYLESMYLSLSCCRWWVTKFFIENLNDRFHLWSGGLHFRIVDGSCFRTSASSETVKLHWHFFNKQLPSTSQSYSVLLTDIALDVSLLARLPGQSGSHRWRLLRHEVTKETNSSGCWFVRCPHGHQQFLGVRFVLKSEPNEQIVCQLANWKATVLRCELWTKVIRPSFFFFTWFVCCWSAISWRLLVRG